jgi:hypothetical protein
VLTVGDDDFDVRRRVGLRPRGQRLVELDRDHLAHPRRDRKRERSCTGADVERAFVAVELQQPFEPLGERRRTFPLHRRAAIGVRAHESVTTRRERVDDVLIRVASS